MLGLKRRLVSLVVILPFHESIINAFSTQSIRPRPDSRPKQATFTPAAPAVNKTDSCGPHRRPLPRKTILCNLSLRKLAIRCQRERKPAIALEALRRLQNLDVVDTVGYNTVLQTFAKVSPGTIEGHPAADHALGLLQDMKRVHQEQVAANEAFYRDLAMDSQEAPLVTVRPDIRSYTIVMDAFARMGTIEAAKQAEKLFKEAQYLAKEMDDVSLAPNAIAYNVLLSAWSKTEGGAKKCIKILHEMPSPTLISYHSLLHALARAKNGEAAERVLRGLPMEPNHRSYTTCMDAWSKSGRPDKAEALFHELRSHKKEVFRPNQVTYASILHAYAVSRSPDKAAKAQQIWDLMKEDGVTPNLFAYNSVLNCFASAPNEPGLMKKIRTIYQQVPHPDELTYGVVLKACGNLYYEDHEYAKRVFERAMQTGHVSDGVLDQFQRAVSYDVFDKVTGFSLPPYIVPTEWKRRVKRHAKRKQEE